MKILLHHWQGGLTLYGVIMGVILIIFGILVFVLLKRATEIQPRQLPQVENAITNRYPSYVFGLKAPWLVHWVPAPLDLVTPEPQAPILEKVLIEPTAVIEQSVNSLTNWQFVANWTFYPQDDFARSPNTFGEFETFSNGEVTIKMAKDWSGFDITPSKDLLTNKCVFWRSISSAEQNEPLSF